LTRVWFFAKRENRISKENWQLQVVFGRAKPSFGGGVPILKDERRAVAERNLPIALATGKNVMGIPRGIFYKGYFRPLFLSKSLIRRKSYGPGEGIPRRQ
jgi:hypothetical protein